MRTSRLYLLILQFHVIIVKEGRMTMKLICCSTVTVPSVKPATGHFLLSCCFFMMLANPRDAIGSTEHSLLDKDSLSNLALEGQTPWFGADQFNAALSSWHWFIWLISHDLSLEENEIEDYQVQDPYNCHYEDLKGHIKLNGSSPEHLPGLAVPSSHPCTTTVHSYSSQLDHTYQFLSFLFIPWKIKMFQRDPSTGF